MPFKTVSAAEFRFPARNRRRLAPRYQYFYLTTAQDLLRTEPLLRHTWPLCKLALSQSLVQKSESGQNVDFGIPICANVRRTGSGKENAFGSGPADQSVRALFA